MRAKAICAGIVVTLFLTCSFFCLIPNSAQASGSEKDEVIKIGVITALSGPAAAVGGRVANGIKVAAKLVNDAGGVMGGRRLKFLIEDGKSDPAESVTVANKLIMHDRVKALIGCYASSATLAVMPLTRKNKIPHLVVISEAEKITQLGHKFLFRISIPSPMEAQLMKPYFPLMGLNKIAFLAVNNDWGRSVVKSYTAGYENAGLRVITAEYISQGEVNFLAQLTKVKNSGADSFHVVTDLASLSALLKQSAELGMKNLVRFSNQIDAELVRDAAGVVAAEGVYTNLTWAPATVKGWDTTENRSFSENYESAHRNLKADYAAAEGYTGVNIIVDALNRARSVDAVAIRDALAKTSLRTPRGLVEFDENGQAHTPVAVFQIQADGSIKSILLPQQ